MNLKWLMVLCCAWNICLVAAATLLIIVRSEPWWVLFPIFCSTWPEGNS